jgi:hypothetical protein
MSVGLIEKIRELKEIYLQKQHPKSYSTDMHKVMISEELGFNVTTIEGSRIYYRSFDFGKDENGKKYRGTLVVDPSLDDQLNGIWVSYGKLESGNPMEFLFNDFEKLHPKTKILKYGIIGSIFGTCLVGYYPILGLVTMGLGMIAGSVIGYYQSANERSARPETLKKEKVQRKLKELIFKNPSIMNGGESFDFLKEYVLTQGANLFEVAYPPSEENIEN